MAAAFGMACLTAVAEGRSADEPKKKGDAVIEIKRISGFSLDPKAISVYTFVVAKEGNWEFKEVTEADKVGKQVKGKLSNNNLQKWAKEIEDALAKVKPKEKWGTDDPYMVITVRSDGRTTEMKVAWEDRLAQAIETRIVEIAKPGKLWPSKKK
jgi:hypothetical protein